MIIAIIVAMYLIGLAFYFYRKNKPVSGDSLDDFSDLLRKGLKGLILFCFYNGCPRLFIRNKYNDDEFIILNSYELMRVTPSTGTG